MDLIWNYLHTTLPKISKMALFLYTIPHSNAAEELKLTMIRKNNSKCRSRLDLATSLNSAILIKINFPEHLNIKEM